MKIAVVGAGLSGLACAWLLGRRHEVTLFERQERPGFSAASVAIDGPHGPVSVDVPLRVFYPGYYPTLSRLYRALGVASEPVSYAGSFADAEGRLYFRYRNLRWGDQSWGVPAPSDLLLGRRAWRILHGLLSFHRDACAGTAAAGKANAVDAPWLSEPQLSIGDLAARQGYAPDFIHGLLLPAIATVCTCSHQQASEFPARVIVDYLGAGLSHHSVRRARHGADDVQRRLLAGIPRLVCQARITAVLQADPAAPPPPGAALRLRMEDGSEPGFDHIVLATQANQARRLLGSTGADAAAVLDGFHYTPVEVVTHRDATLLPQRRRDWSPVNLRVSAQHAGPEASIWINAVQPALKHAADLFQTVAPHQPPRAELVLGRAHFERPLVDRSSQAALTGLQALHRQPGRRLWFCGAYAQAGIPLLESAVRSAHDVAERLGAALDDAG